MKHTIEYQGLLQSGLFQDYEKERSRQWKIHNEIEGVADTPFLSPDIMAEKMAEMFESFSDVGFDDFRLRFLILFHYEPTIEEYVFFLCDSLHNIKVKRTIRLKQRVFNCISSGNGIFGTLTFTDEVLNNTSSDTRRQYVRRFLQKHSSVYVANIDFGEHNGREHYHFVAKDFDKTEWNYGFKKYKSVRFQYDGVLDDFKDRFGHIKQDDINRLSKYLAKLTNHALKTLGTGKRFIYSR